MAEAETAKAGMTPQDGPGASRPPWDWNRVLTPRIVILMLPVVALAVWAYWYPMMRWEAVWRHSSAWGHGYLIPVIAVLIAHFRLNELPPKRIEPCLWGLVPILAGLVMRIWAQTLMYGYPGEVTFLLVAAGVVLLLLGWDMLRALWIPVAYLGLMIPWDSKYYESLALPLQTFGAAMAERFLTLTGMAVIREGNVLNLGPGRPLTVAEACSGLHLLFTFVALGVMMAYLYRRPLWERLLIMASSIPIAVVCNVIRVILMAVSSEGLFFERQAVAGGAPTWSAHVPGFVWGWIPGAGLADKLIALRDSVLNPESYPHQGLGFLMLGLAFVLMWAELKVVDMFFIEEDGPAEQRDSAGP